MPIHIITARIFPTIITISSIIPIISTSVVYQMIKQTVAAKVPFTMVQAMPIYHLGVYVKELKSETVPTKLSRFTI